MTLERMLPVECDQAIETVKQFVLDQVVLQLTTVSTRLDTTVADHSLPPENNQQGSHSLAYKKFQDLSRTPKRFLRTLS